MVRPRLSQGSEDGKEENEDAAANLLLGEEAFFPEFSDDIFGVTTEIEMASHRSVIGGDDVTYVESQHEVPVAMEHDIDGRKVGLLNGILMSFLCRIHSGFYIVLSQYSVLP